MAVQGVAASVVAAGGAGVGVPGGVLDVLEGDAGLAGAGDERDPQRVRADLPGGLEADAGARRRIIFQASGWAIRLPVRVANSGPLVRPSR